MLLHYKNNFVGYFRFYYNVVGSKLVISIFLSVFVSVLDGLGLSMLMPLLQSVSGENQDPEASMGQLHYVTDLITGFGFALTPTTVLVAMAVLFILKGIIKYIEMNYQAGVAQYFMKRIRHDLVSSLKGLSYKGFTQLDAGSIQNSFIAEAQKMSLAIKNYLAYSQSFLMLATYVLFAMLANYQFAILFAVSAGLTNLLYSRIYKKMKTASYDVSKRGNKFNAYMIQAVHYFKYLKATNYIGSYSLKLRKVIEQTETLNRKIAQYNAVTTSMREPMVMLIVVSVIYVQLTWLGGNISSIILSLVLFYRALNFLMVMQQSWQNFVQHSGALRSVSKMAHTMKGLAEQQGGRMFHTLSHDIVIRDVDVSYGINKVLNGANVVVAKNNTIALVGESGSGKTTLANIITGLVKPDAGEVLLDGISINDYNLDSFRSKIGYISQESVIFNDNIFNNITFWAEPTPEAYERFWHVVEMASLSAFVNGLSEKENTQLGDNGLLISGGQKQRISIAREMYKNAEILILDEATSALDSETELMIQENIEKLHGQYTMIVIAHRLSTIKEVDCIYLLEKGKVAVSGGFEDMVRNSEKFKRMVALQGL